MKKSVIAATLVLSLFTANTALADSNARVSMSVSGFGTEDVPAGVLCAVEDVTVLAATEEDCGKIGGTATHTVTTVKTPVKK